MTRKSFIKSLLALPMIAATITALGNIKPQPKLVAATNIKQDSLSKINARRILAEIKKDLERVAIAYKGEINDDTTRNHLNSTIRDMMDRKYISPRLVYNYNLINDETTNSPSSIDRNIMYGQMWIQVSPTIEYVIIDFVID